MSLVVGTLGAAALAYGGAVALAWRFQERFMFPVRHSGERVEPQGGWRVGEAPLPGIGAMRFRYREPAPGAPDGLPVVIYLHGNASSTRIASGYTNFLPEAGFPTVAGSYPGYSGNPGSPGEAGLKLAAEALEGWARRRWPGRLVAAWGESLGGFPAAHLAATGRAELLVLDSAFTSMVEAARHHMPWIPAMARLVRHPMGSLELLSAMERPVPTLVLVTERDPVVPTHMGERIAAAVPGAKLHRAPVKAHPAVVWDNGAAEAAVAWLRAAAR